MENWRFFKPNAVPSTDDLKNDLNSFELKITKFPNDSDAIGSLLNDETALGDEFKEIVSDYCAADINDNSPVMVMYRATIDLLKNRARQHNEKTVKADYYRSKTKQLMRKRDEIECASNEISSKVVRIQNFSVNYEQTLDAQCELLNRDLRNILLDRFFDFKFSVDFNKHFLHFVLSDPLTKEIVYFQCRFAQADFEAGMIYTILLQFYRSRQRDLEMLRDRNVPVSKRFFNAKSFLETVNSLPNSYRFFL